MAFLAEHKCLRTNKFLNKLKKKKTKPEILDSQIMYTCLVPMFVRFRFGAEIDRVFFQLIVSAADTATSGKRRSEAS